MIYVFSNVEYPEENRIHPNKEDLLVFVNKANSITYYKDHINKIIFRRMPKPEYGEGYEGVESFFAFEGPKDHTIPKDIMDKIKKEYNWDFDIEKCKVRCCTTGYMCIKYIEAKYPDQEIVLVNFGYEVKNSTYRCPWHNWKFENEELSKYKHIYTAPTMEHPKIEIVYGSDQNYLDRVNMSATTVLKNNPNAHITVLSESPLKTEYDNIVVNIKGIKFKGTEGRLSNAAYLRLFIPEYLPYDKVIYLDGDCLCRAPLDPLWNMDIPYIGLCHSHDVGIKQAEEIGIPKYGMSAVMVMNLPALKSIEFTKTALYAMQHFKFPKTHWYCDETLLNCCFYDYFKFLPTKWCYCFNRSYSKYGERLTSNDANIVHFIGGQYEAQKEFFKKGKY